jgi:hypothetical protein
MHRFDFNVLCCVHLAKPYLPEELRKIIFENCDPVFKQARRDAQNPPFCGTSKFARGRRAVRYYKCLNCGKWSHPGRCGRRKTESQYEFLQLMRLGAIRYPIERPPKEYNRVWNRIQEDIIFIKYKAKIDVSRIKEALHDKERRQKGIN